MGVIQNATNNVIGSISRTLLFSQKMSKLANSKEAKAKTAEAKERATDGNLRAQEAIDAKTYQKRNFAERVEAVKKNQASISDSDAHKILSQIKMDRRKMKRYKRLLKENDQKKGAELNNDKE